MVKIIFSFLILCCAMFGSLCESEPEVKESLDNQNEGREDMIETFLSQHYTSSTGFLYSKSTLHFAQLAKFDNEIYNELKNYAEILRQRLELINEYVHDFEKNSLHDHINLENVSIWHWATLVAAHPVTALRLLRRMTTKLPVLLQSVENGREGDFMDFVYEAKGQLDWPVSDDVELVSRAILDLPIVYDLSIQKIAEGTDESLTTDLVSFPLDASECNDIGVIASKLERYASAIQWLDAAWSRFLIEDTNGYASIPAEVLEQNFQNAIMNHDSVLEKLTTETSDLSLHWDFDLFQHKVTGLKRFANLPSLTHLYETTRHFTDFHSTVKFWNLCAGANYQDETYYCFYQKKHHPYYLLNPLKVEILNLFPHIIQLHDIISQSESLNLISEAIPIIETANAPGLIENNVDHTPIPASIDNFRSKFEERVKLLSRMRQCCSSSQEHLNVGVYSFGNYDAAKDTFPTDNINFELSDEDRDTFTFHVFLNELKYGGRTVFPRLGFSAEPRQGSAIIWSTYEMNGIGHPDLFWTNCPIAVGNKWVASKYVRRSGSNLRFMDIFQHF